MGLAGTTDSSVYEGLKDVLQRHPRITMVAYEPDTIVKKFLRARIDPDRTTPPTGPDSPRLDVEWRFEGADQSYRIHYADPNTGLNCGWHCDEDHPKLGPVHFQYETPSGEQDYEPATFEKEIPTEILWTVLARLFDQRLPELARVEER
jgi:hypothetical protein